MQTESALLHGLVEPNESTVAVCHFEYGTTTTYGLIAPCNPVYIFSYEISVAVSAFVTGLQPGTTYHMRLFAVNEVGPGWGPDTTFTTPAPPAPPPPPPPVPPPPPQPVPPPAPPPVVATCIVPNLKRHSLERAKLMLAKADCKLGRVTRPHRRHRLVVSRQSLAPNTKVAAGTAVNLVLVAQK